MKARTGAALAAALLTAGLGLPAAAAGEAGSSADATAGKIEDRLERQLAGGAQTETETTFWVRLGGRADLSAARETADKGAKAVAVLRTGTSYARQSQAGLRAMLREEGAAYEPYWIANAVKVTGDAGLAERIAQRPDVTEILADFSVPLVEPVEVSEEGPAEDPSVNLIEWNIADIRAPEVWSEFGDRGEGVVVGTIDTGVQWDHPALKAAYRGTGEDGSADHDYSWYDPAAVCAEAAPCDDVGHGTHVTGTMTGADGDNMIGVAPGAKWIAAKGCETTICSSESLLAAGQWMIAPTDLDGGNPRPDLAPDVINNSWGMNAYNPFYEDIVAAWRAAGIFPSFAAGNIGPTCGTVGSPGDYATAYATGANTPYGGASYFSSRGAAADGTVKPDISAPGQTVRSSYPDGSYALATGTSMAAPHTSATVALIWSAAPGLRGDVAATMELLGGSAVDVEDTSCGGTAEKNNVNGEGRLDAHAAVAAALAPEPAG